MAASLRTRMLQGESVFGTWCMLPSSFVVDVVARSGVDFVVIDLEHGSISLETSEEMVRAAQLQGCQAIIRVGDAQENTILHALETGCEAVLVPHVSTEQEASAVVQRARYAPLGSRGVSPYTRCHDFDHTGLIESIFRHANETLVGVLVEGVEGLRNVEAIASIEGIDLVYLGIYDISQSVGVPGDIEHPLVRDELKRCVSLIRSAGAVPGTFTRDLDDALSLREAGFGFVAYLADSYGLLTFFRNAVQKYHGR